MIASIVHDLAPITLIGGGDASIRDVEEATALAPRVVAADGGAALALAAGRVPEAVIGDFDSLPEELRRRLPGDILHPLPGQDDTDFGKAMARIDAPLVLGVGFGGGRVDHQLAAYHTLARMPHRPCVLIDRTEIICLAPPRLLLPCAPGDIVSLFPQHGAALADRRYRVCAGCICRHVEPRDGARGDRDGSTGHAAHRTASPSQAAGAAAGGTRPRALARSRMTT
jgi:thiamine pyrophosphokinase